MHKTRSTNYFKASLMIDKQLKLTQPDWFKTLLRCCRADMQSLQEKIRSLLRHSYLKEYRSIMNGLLKLKKCAAAVQEIEDPQDPGHAIVNQTQMNRLLVNRYT